MADQIPDSAKSRAAFALAASKIDRDARLSDLTDAEIDALIAATRAAPPAPIAEGVTCVAKPLTDDERKAAIDKWMAPPAMDREAVGLDWRVVAKLAGEHGVRYRTNRAFEQFVTAILSTLSADAIRQGEGLQLAVADALNAAWALCDDTENGDSDQPSVPRDAWKRLADTLDALEAIIPKSEQPCWPGVAARLLAGRAPAISGLQPVPGHAAGCGVHDGYDCDCPATPASHASDGGK